MGSGHDRDLLNPSVMRDGMHDWVLANENMAKALAAKGYEYQFVFCRNSAHCDGAVKNQTLPAAGVCSSRGKTVTLNSADRLALLYTTKKATSRAGAATWYWQLG